MELIVIWLALCLIPAYIASQKGRSGAGYFLLGVVLSPLIALIVVVLVSNQSAAVGAQAAAGTPVAAASAVDALTKLVALRDAGEVTDAEFQRQRAILMAPPAPTGPTGDGWVR